MMHSLSQLLEIFRHMLIEACKGHKVFVILDELESLDEESRQALSEDLFELSEKRRRRRT